MKRMIFLGIVVSVFAFAGMANASAEPLCTDDGILEPDAQFVLTGPNTFVLESCNGVPEEKLLPNRWVVIGDCDPPVPFSWFADHRGRGNQGGFDPGFTFDCNCAGIIEKMEAYDPELVLDGHRKFGCSKSLIEEFIDEYGDVVW